MILLSVCEQFLLGYSVTKDFLFSQCLIYHITGLATIYYIIITDFIPVDLRLMKLFVTIVTPLFNREIDLFDLDLIRCLQFQYLRRVFTLEITNIFVEQIFSNITACPFINFKNSLTGIYPINDCLHHLYDRKKYSYRKQHLLYIVFNFIVRINDVIRANMFYANSDISSIVFFNLFVATSITPIHYYLLFFFQMLHNKVHRNFTICNDSGIFWLK